MKKIKRFAYAGAVLLLSAGFAACSSEDEMAQENIKRGVVKTDFNIAIPSTMATRMTAAITQSAGTAESFRGIDSIRLIPFAVGSTTATKDIIASTSTRLGNMITLTTNGIPDDLTAVNTITTLNANNNSQLYKDVEVPVGTKSFLFYGVAKKTTGTPKEVVEGVLCPTGLNDNTMTPADIHFNLVKIYTGSKGDIADKLVAYLNSIVNAGSDQTFGTNAWSNAASPLYTVYTEFIKTVTGASKNVEAVVEDLYIALQSKSDPVATAIKNAIANATYATATPAAAATSDTPATPASVVLIDGLQGYPGNLNLPDGAAFIKFTNGAFATADSPADAMNLNIANLADFAYPASLYYRVNSTIATDNEKKEKYYAGTNAKTTWAGNDGVLSVYTENPGEVKGSTRSVAIIEQIQYAVGRLDTKVKRTSGTTLQDAEGTNITIGTNGLKVTGILIGGQKKVDYLFAPEATSSELTIYDSQMDVANYFVNTSYTTGQEVAIRTLALETEADAEVQFAIELENNTGVDFVGKDGIVPKGCKFYLVGKMIPTGDNKNTSGTLTQVFKQDYYTVLEATISSLANAYSTVPDLRVPQLELGLSVNLEWQAANTYTVTLQ